MTQFVLSLVLLIGTFIVRDQILYMKNKDLGIKKDNIIYIRRTGGLWNDYERFKTELLKHSDIVNVTSSSTVFLRPPGTTGVDWEGKAPDYRVYWKQFSVDYDYFDTFELEMAEGRKFSRENTTDAASAYIINETGADVLGFENPVGKRFALWDMEGKIIGVVKDFHTKSLHEKVEPVMLWINQQRARYTWFFVRIKSSNVKNTLKFIEDVHKELNPSYPFQFHFIDEEYENLYISEERISSLFDYFSLIAIFISCLGLFGLSSFITEQRTKEICIRKIFGANVRSIILRFLKEFLRWVIIANIIAWPIGYFVMNKWLQNFAYRINFNWNVLIFAGVITFMIAVLTVSYKSVKAAAANPVEGLRNE